MTNPADTEEEPELRLASRAGDFVFSVVVRPLMLVFWSFAAWGSFWWCLFLWRCATAGWPAAVESATPAGRDAAWGYLNLAGALLALVVWGLLAWGTAARRR